MKKIYIAGSFSNDVEREQLNTMINTVREENPDAELFIPMLGFIPGGNDKDENGEYIMPNYVWARAVFTMDVDAIDSCDEVIALYRGRYSGTGTAWEIGMAYSLNKKIVLIGLDDTTFLSHTNVMLAFTGTCTTLREFGKLLVGKDYRTIEIEDKWEGIE